MKFILTNAFSINMLAREGQDISFVPVHIQAVKNLLRNETWESAIGHPDTATVLSGMLDKEIKFNRTNVQLVPGQTSLIVCQYRGPRLQEGAFELPENATIEFWQVYFS